MKLVCFKAGSIVTLRVKERYRCPPACVPLPPVERSDSADSAFHADPALLRHEERDVSHTDPVPRFAFRAGEENSPLFGSSRSRLTTPLLAPVSRYRTCLSRSYLVRRSG